LGFACEFTGREDLGHRGYGRIPACEAGLPKPTFHPSFDQSRFDFNRKIEQRSVNDVYSMNEGDSARGPLRASQEQSSE
jgi:hypothetical protein